MVQAVARFWHVSYIKGDVSSVKVLISKKMVDVQLMVHFAFMFKVTYSSKVYTPLPQLLQNSIALASFKIPYSSTTPPQFA